MAIDEKHGMVPSFAVSSCSADHSGLRKRYLDFAGNIPRCGECGRSGHRGHASGRVAIAPATAHQCTASKVRLRDFPDKVIAVYKRTNFLDMRGELLEEWSAFLLNDDSSEGPPELESSEKS